MRIALVSNEPPPYRIPVFRLAAQAPGVDLLVIFCCRREPNRLWDLPPLEFPHTFLKERIVARNGRYIHHNPDVISVLRRYAPDMVVTDGFNPTHLYAFAYAALKRCAHVAMTDGTDASEKSLGIVHRTIRRIVYSRSHAYVAASDGGYRLFSQYGIAAGDMFKSCLCADNGAFDAAAFNTLPADKRFDFIFSGRLEEVKNPLFAIDVAVAASKMLGRRLSILFAGSGSMDNALKTHAAAKVQWIDATFHGFAAQTQLPSLYRSARIFLFPTVWDPWGVVANEACAAGLPVIVSPHAGVAGELVRDQQNGFVCTLDVDAWSGKAAALLSDPALYRRFSEASSNMVRAYTYRGAADGLIAACRHAQSAPHATMQTTGK
jgi:glycosyltransferase involved in cell wall biosynthesis